MSESIAAAADEATLTPVKAGQASQQGEGGGEDAPAFLADTQSTDHGRDGSQDSPSPLTQQGLATPDSLGDEAGRPQSATLQSETSVREVPPHAGTVAVDTHSEPGNGQAGETPVVAPRQAGEASSDASPVAANHNFTRIPVLGEVR